MQNRQLNFLQKLTLRSDFNQSPVCKAIELAQSVGFPAGRYLQNLMSGTNRPIAGDLDRVKARVYGSDSTRRKTYLLFNPELTIHQIYTDPTVPESDRIAFSQIRLGSHFLKIETGRWTRIERERRLCPCGQIQTEQHVLLHCPLTQSSRVRHSRLNFADLRSLMATDDVANVAKFCCEVLAHVSNMNDIR